MGSDENGTCPRVCGNCGNEDKTVSLKTWGIREDDVANEA